MDVKVRATIWICPTPGCGNYYAASNAGDLAESYNLNHNGQRSFNRAECPDCRIRGTQVQRVAVDIRPTVPEPAA
jgi:hypothetical protein